MVRPGDDRVWIAVRVRPSPLFPYVTGGASEFAGQCLHERRDVGDILPIAGRPDVSNLPEPGSERHRIVLCAIRWIVPEPDRYVRAAACRWSYREKGDGVRTELCVSILEP